MSRHAWSSNIGRHRRRSFVPTGVFALLVSTATALEGAEISASATARWGSLTSTFEQQSLSGVPLGANATTGVVSVDSGAIKAAGVATSSLATNSVGASSAWVGSSVLTTPNSGPARRTFATGRIDIDDTLVVESSVLAAGSPVQVNFTLAVAGSVSASHTRVQGGFGNEARSLATVEGSVTHLGGPGASVFISDGDHRAFVGTSGTVLAGALGLFDPATPTLTFSVDTEVGATLRFFMRVRADVNGDVSPATPSPSEPLQNQSGSAGAQVGLAFGATAGTPDVVLASSLFGGAFPLASQATVTQALLGQPAAPVVVPVPAAWMLLALALPGLVTPGAYMRGRTVRDV